MTGISFGVEGLDQALAAVQKHEAAQKRNEIKSLKASAKPVVAAVKQEAPKRHSTAELRVLSKIAKASGTKRAKTVAEYVTARARENPFSGNTVRVLAGGPVAHLLTGGAKEHIIRVPRVAKDGHQITLHHPGVQRKDDFVRRGAALAMPEAMRTYWDTLLKD